MTARRAAFDPSRLDDEIDDLLPPPPLSVVPAGTARTPAERRGEPTDRVVPERQPAVDGRPDSDK